MNPTTSLFPIDCEESASQLENSLYQTTIEASAPPLMCLATLTGDEVETIDADWALVAASSAMREVRRQVYQLRAIDAPVLLLGECGTGKEVIARLLHRLSSIENKKFVKINCAGLPLETMQRHLAARDSKPAATAPGAAQQRTLLFDNIAELPLTLQSVLLHALQPSPAARFEHGNGGAARILAATSSDLEREVKAGKFRLDLYYRLNAFTIHLPPLRERREDIPLLLEHFVNTWSIRYCRPRPSISPRILECCAGHSWPGNVRELENFAKRHVVFGDEKTLLESIEPISRNRSNTTEADATSRISHDGLKRLVGNLRRETEKAAILQALEKTRGCKQDAAGLLNISLRTLHYKIRRYEIETVRIARRDQLNGTANRADQ